MRSQIKKPPTDVFFEHNVGCQSFFVLVEVCEFPLNNFSDLAASVLRLSLKVSVRFLPHKVHFSMKPRSKRLLAANQNKTQVKSEPAVKKQKAPLIT